MGKSLNITGKNFEAEVLKHQGLAIVDFGAAWCGPCKALAPTIDELAGDYAGTNVKIGKCDIDDEKEGSDGLASDFGVMSVPTILFFKNGKKVDMMMGNQPKAALKDKIEKLRV